MALSHAPDEERLHLLALLPSISMWCLSSGYTYWYAGMATCMHACLPRENETKALFSSEKISDFATVALSFLFDKYYLIMD